MAIKHMRLADDSDRGIGIRKGPLEIIDPIRDTQLVKPATKVQKDELLASRPRRAPQKSAYYSTRKMIARYPTVRIRFLVIEVECGVQR